MSRFGPAFLVAPLILGACVSARNKTVRYGRVEEVQRYSLEELERLERCVFADTAYFYRTAMNCAARQGRADMVRALLSKGVVPRGGNALSNAAHKNHLEVVKILLDAGDDPSWFDGEWHQDMIRKHADPEISHLLAEAVARAKKQEEADARLKIEAAKKQIELKIERTEKLGDIAARQGNAAKALALYAESYRACPEDHPSKGLLLDKMFDVARLMSPSAAVPDDAGEHAERADSFIRQAKDRRGFVKAVAELKQALELAPWWGEAYYNLGLTCEKAGDPSGAVRALKLYLKAAPDAAEKGSVLGKIRDLEVAQELE